MFLKAHYYLNQQFYVQLIWTFKEVFLLYHDEQQWIMTVRLTPFFLVNSLDSWLKNNTTLLVITSSDKASIEKHTFKQSTKAKTSSY